MIDEIISGVREAWAEFGFTSLYPDDMSILLQSRNRVILFFIDPKNGQYPRVVVKLERHGKYRTWSDEFVKNTQILRRRFDGKIKNTIPVMKVIQCENNNPLVLEKGLPGIPINVRSNTKEMEYHEFANWLIEFHSRCFINQIEITQDYIVELLNRNRYEYGVGEIEQKMVRDVLFKLIGVRANTGWVVGDTHPSNILIDNGVVTGVIDWEGIAENKFQFYDWYQFIFSVIIEHAKFGLKTASHNEIMKRGLSLLFNKPDSKLAKILNRQTDYYFETYGLPKEFILNLFVLFLVDYYWIENKRELLESLLPELLTH